MPAFSNICSRWDRWTVSEGEKKKKNIMKKRKEKKKKKPIMSSNGERENWYLKKRERGKDRAKQHSIVSTYCLNNSSVQFKHVSACYSTVSVVNQKSHVVCPRPLVCMMINPITSIKTHLDNYIHCFFINHYTYFERRCY